MKKGFSKATDDVIRKSDIVLEILDARYVSESRNLKTENKIKSYGKKLIYVANKCDLVDKDVIENQMKALKPSAFVSAKKHYGMTILKRLIIRESNNIADPKVGVIGYPNVGKSSIINMLKGAKAAITGSMPGITRGLQLVRAGKIMLIDAPGVIPFSEKDPTKHALMGAKSFVNSEDPSLVVMDIMKERPGLIEYAYGVAVSDDKEKTLEEIALKSNSVIKGNKPDINRISKRILMRIMKAEIKI